MILSGTSTISGFAACSQVLLVHVSDMQSGASVNAFRVLKMVNLPDSEVTSSRTSSAENGESPRF